MRIRIAARTSGIAAGGMWASVFAGTFAPVNFRLLADVRSVAVTLSLAALGFWATCKVRGYVDRRLGDGGMTYLLDAMLSQRAAARQAPTQPLRVVR